VSIANDKDKEKSKKKEVEKNKVHLVKGKKGG
jgi:hypothetical protein